MSTTSAVIHSTAAPTLSSGGSSKAPFPMVSEAPSARAPSVSGSTAVERERRRRLEQQLGVGDDTAGARVRDEAYMEEMVAAATSVRQRMAGNRSAARSSGRSG